MPIARPGMRKNIQRKGISKGGPSIGTSNVSGGSVINRIHRFPARITGISGQIIPGGRITISGVDFGYRRGRVIINYRTCSAPIFLRIISWSETSIEAEIPLRLASSIHGEPMAATLWVFPARVPDRPTPPGDWEGEEALEEYRGYHYNGQEGPSYPIRVQPITPTITSFSSTVVNEGDSLGIQGRNFGRHGTLTLLNGSRRIPFTLNRWSNRHIQVSIPFNALESFGNPESATVTVRVENEYQNETTATNAVTIRRAYGYDLALAGIRVSNYHIERHRSRRRTVTYFSVSPVVRNNGPDESENRIDLVLFYDNHRHTSSLITSPISAGREVEAPPVRLELREGRHRIYVGIMPYPANYRLHHGDPNNNACYFNVTGNGIYRCESPVPYSSGL